MTPQKNSAIIITEQNDWRNEKMTDEKIIKALECCEDCDKGNCNKCEYRIYRYRDCQEKAMRDVMKLINRQKAEIEKLKEELADARYLNTVAEYDGIKEFAERLWDELLYNAEVTYDLLDDRCVDVFDKNKTSIILDSLVKEMTEGD